MRISPVTIDDGLVFEFEGQIVFQPRFAEQGHGALMNHSRFAVHVGQVEEGPLRERQKRIGAGADSLLRQREGQRVLREGAGRVAINIARELVEHDDFRQPSFGRVAPFE